MGWIIWEAISISGLVLSITLGLQFLLRRRRDRRLRGLELRPNCLLTRHPILLVASRRSLFRLFEPWNEVPGYLREHGYEVFILEPDFHRARTSVRHQIYAALETLAAESNLKQPKFHLIAESSLEPEWVQLARESHRYVASLTLAVRECARHRTIASLRNVDAFKPLASTIEELNLDDGTPLLSGFNQEHRLWNRIAVLLLRVHNAFMFLRDRRFVPIDPVAVGQILTTDWWIESRFLNRAIELAERDANPLSGIGPS